MASQSLRQLPLRGDALHRMLTAELSRAGCFRPARLRCAVYAAVIFACYAAAYATLLTGPGFPLRALAIGLLAFVSVQAGFIAHEAGHGAITRDRGLANLIGQLCHTLAAGFTSS